MKKIQCYVDRVVEAYFTQGQSFPTLIVLLEEESGERGFPIITKEEESGIAIFISMKIGGFSNFEKYNPYKTTMELLKKHEVEVEEVYLHPVESEGDSAYATIVTHSNGKRLVTEAEPCDAINIALQSDAPIYIEEQMLISEDMEEYHSLSNEKFIEEEEEEEEEEAHLPAIKNLSECTEEELYEELESSIKNENYERASKIKTEIARRRHSR